jgi:hypothetical protein
MNPVVLWGTPVIDNNNISNTQSCEMEATLVPHSIGPEMMYALKNTQLLTMYFIECI